MSTLKVINLQHPSYANNNVVLDANGNMTCTGTVVGGTTTGFRNKIINGNFDVWQRGTSGTYSTAAYTVADRWLWISDGTSSNTITISRQSFTVGQTEVPDNPKYYMQVAYGIMGTPSNYIRTNIEGVGTLAGQTATFSFWAKCASGTVAAGAGYQQEFGTGGSPSAGVYPSWTAFTITSTWTKYTFNFNIGSISGKTLGTNNDDKLNVLVGFPTNAAGTVLFSQMQLEAGSIATRFETKPVARELALCQRYFQIYSQPMLRGVCTGPGAGRMGMTLPVVMRAAPTAVVGALPIYDGTATTTVSSVQVAYLATDHVEFDFVLAATLNANRPCMVYTSGSTTMTLSAEV